MRGRIPESGSRSRKEGVRMRALYILLEWMALVERVLYRLTFSLSDAHLLDVDDRAYIKKMMKECTRVRGKYSKEVDGHGTE